MLRATAPRSLPALSRVASDPDPPLAPDLFRSPRRSGSYTQGDATYLSLARSFSDPPDPAAIHRLLARMRLDPRRPFPERLFFPLFRAFSRSNLPLHALHLFDEMLPCFHCPPTVRSLNSALSALLSSPSSVPLALPFYSRALRSHPSISPNFLTSNLLLKALSHSPSSRDRAILLFRSLPSRDAYSYSILLEALSCFNRLDEALSLLYEMQLDGVPPPQSLSTPSSAPSVAPATSPAPPSSPATCSSRAAPPPPPPTTPSSTPSASATSSTPPSPFSTAWPATAANPTRSPTAPSSTASSSSAAPSTPTASSPTWTRKVFDQMPSSTPPSSPASSVAAIPTPPSELGRS
ncbi:hypothetical protein J5N97_016671 [Dioscorea zingiberensis]|uniref:Pentatricopeptide repeat-containing protein n=1 Tax=Dioscorea zingiberensis TaxID=325984 RepID=A0A9D5CJW6_9LILI|nr:hypothetical protein J5N97_016671 [Dioscorea zingiberensis]